MGDLASAKKWTEKPPRARKQEFLALLQRLDPAVRREVQYDWLYSPVATERSPREAAIAAALVEHCRETRHLNRVKANADPEQLFADARCKGRARTLEFDFVLPNVGVAIEFDEKQHFTAERGLTFDFYDPAEFAFVNRWKNLCSSSIRDPDKSNPARDWQRAFKDAVRDLRSREHEVPLVRLYYRDFEGERLRERDVLDRLAREIEEAKARFK